MRFTGFLGIKGNEDLVDFITTFVVAGSGGHHVEKFFEFDLSTAVFVELSNHLIDSLGLGLNTQGIDGDFKF